MQQIELRPELNFLSEFYALDAPVATLLAEYPSSNSDQTVFQNPSRFIIHDPFPPPRPELLKTLGPHHLMFGWGNRLEVTSQIAPPAVLLDHWVNLLSETARPVWQPWSNVPSDSRLITLFPHESIPFDQQVVDPETNYAIHSKEVIQEIDCPQAEVFDGVSYPCIAKLSHGYAGLGNFLIRNSEDEQLMREELARHWPSATLVFNSIIENITGDFGVQFYLQKDGTAVWLGLTEQNFNEDNRWCGGTYSASLQVELLEPMADFVLATAKHLHSMGYFGLVGIDLLRNNLDEYFLVDVNPRLTGISPFLMASRIFDRDQGLSEGIYLASVNYSGSLQQLLDQVSQHNELDDRRVVVLSAFEETNQTICHLSLSSQSQETNRDLRRQLLS